MNIYFCNITVYVIMYIFLIIHHLYIYGMYTYSIIIISPLFIILS